MISLFLVCYNLYFEFEVFFFLILSIQDTVFLSFEADTVHTLFTWLHVRRVVDIVTVLDRRVAKIESGTLYSGTTTSDNILWLESWGNRIYESFSSTGLERIDTLFKGIRRNIYIDTIFRIIYPFPYDTVRIDNNLSRFYEIFLEEILIFFLK